MRALVCLLAVIPMAHARIGPYTGEDPRSITLVFKSGNVTFNLSNGVAKTIDFRVGDKLYSTPLAGCIPLEHIRFDTAMFDVGENRREGYFTMTFQMGAEESRAFGQLALIQISFNDSRLVARLITRQIAERHGFTSPLCPGGTR